MVGTYSFRFKGTTGASYNVKEVESRKIESIPDNVYGFRFFDREETVVDGKKVHGKMENLSPWTYVGKSFTMEEIAKQFPEEKILLQNMEINHWNRAVLSKFNNWVPLSEEDIVIPSIQTT